MSEISDVSQTKRPAVEALDSTEENPVFVTEDNFTAHDVVLGKGNGITSLPGNVMFRQIVSRYKPLYTATPRKLKTSIAVRVVDEISAMWPPGRFLEPRADNKLRYQQISRKRALEKACQALREKRFGMPEVSAQHHTTQPLATSNLHPSPKKQFGLVGSTAATVAIPTVHQQPPIPPLPNHVSPTSQEQPSKLPVTDKSLLQKDVLIQSDATRVHAMLQRSRESTTAVNHFLLPRPPTVPAPSSFRPVEARRQKKKKKTDASGKSDKNEFDSSSKVSMESITEEDVLYGGRGRKHFHRVSNQRFMELIKINQETYHNSVIKKHAAMRIIQEWKNRNPNGRFLQQDSKTDDWYELSEYTIIEKTCQALRDLKRERAPAGLQHGVMELSGRPSGNVPLLPRPLTSPQGLVINSGHINHQPDHQPHEGSPLAGKTKSFESVCQGAGSRHPTNDEEDPREASNKPVRIMGTDLIPPRFSLEHLASRSSLTHPVGPQTFSRNGGLPYHIHLMANPYSAYNPGLLSSGSPVSMMNAYPFSMQVSTVAATSGNSPRQAKRPRTAAGTNPPNHENAGTTNDTKGCKETNSGGTVLPGITRGIERKVERGPTAKKATRGKAPYVSSLPSILSRRRRSQRGKQEERRPPGEIEAATLLASMFGK